jgi:hypothetical protein
MAAADWALYVTIIAGVSNVALAILTAAYVVLTRQMVGQMKAAREPSVFVDFEFLDRVTRLVIGNSSDSPALNIRFSANETIPWQQAEEGLAHIDAVRNGLPFLAPRRMLKFHAGYVDWTRLEETNGLANIRIVFENELKHQFKREYTLDIRKFDQVAGDSFQEPSAAIAKAIHDAEQSRRHDQIMQGFSRRLFSKPKTKPCPYCAMAIPLAAKKCHECHEFMTDPSPDGTDQTVPE